MTDATGASLFTGHDGPRLYAGVLSESRNLIRERLCAALTAAREPVAEALRSRIEGAAGPVEPQALRELRDHIQAGDDKLERAFGAAFDHGFRTLARRYSATTTSLYQTDTEGTMELSLVDDQAFSEALVIRNQASVMESACEAELKDLQPRIALMMGVADLDRSTNPVGPEAVSEALKHACWSLQSPQPTGILLFELLTSELTQALNLAYRELNKHLVARKVLPHVRHAVKRGGAHRKKVRKARPQEFNDETVEVLRQLFVPREAREAGAATAGSEAGSTISVDANVLQMLTRLQRGESETFLGSDRFAFDPAAASTVNVLHGLVESGLGKHVGAVDGIVIDVVATLFDFIFDDERVPEAMKGLIGRLQLPVLKQALVDRSFFANRLHPARRLISAMAHAASTWDGPFSPDTSLYQCAEPLVVRIQNQAGEDNDIFATSLAAFETFLAEQELRVDEKAAVLTTRLEQRERQEIARSMSDDAIAPYIDDPSIAETIRTFLAGPWRAVLISAVEHGGEEGEAWSEALETMTSLLWSVRPMRDAEERQRLVKLLPSLLRGLRSGLDATTVQAGVREAFFTELVKLHAAAVKSGMSAAQRQAGADAAGASANAEPPADRRAEDAPPAPVEMDALVRGTWVELRIESDELRAVRLTWVSPARTMYLFANRQGQRALALTKTELARKFAAGDAVLVDDEPFIDKIVAEVLDEYQRSDM